MEEIDASLRQVFHALGEGRQMGRRAFLRGFALAGALAGCATQERPPVEQVQSEQPTPAPRLRAAFSHNGLKTLWNQRGRDTARFLGELLGIAVLEKGGV